MPVKVPANLKTAFALCVGPDEGVIEPVPITPVAIVNDTFALVRLMICTPASMPSITTILGLAATVAQAAAERLREAKALLSVRCWSGAYYLAGYAVECGLKACIIKYLMTTDQFPERRLYHAITDKKHGVFAWIKSHW